MTLPRRSDVRKAIGAKIEADLVGESLPAAAFAAYTKTDFDGASPVITLASSGSDIPPLTPLGSTDTHYFEINTLIIRPNQAETDSGYSESDSEDALDNVYEEIKQWISNNRKDKSVEEIWKHIAIAARSNIIPIIDDGGRGYFMENIPIVVEVF